MGEQLKPITAEIQESVDRFNRELCKLQPQPFKWRTFFLVQLPLSIFYASIGVACRIYKNQYSPDVRPEYALYVLVFMGLLGFITGLVLPKIIWFIHGVHYCKKRMKEWLEYFDWHLKEEKISPEETQVITETCDRARCLGSRFVRDWDKYTEQEQWNVPEISLSVREKLNALHYFLNQLEPKPFTASEFFRVSLPYGAICGALMGILVYFGMPYYLYIQNSPPVMPRTLLVSSISIGMLYFCLISLNYYSERYIKNPSAYRRDVKKYLAELTVMLHQNMLTPEEKAEISAICERAQAVLRKTTLFPQRTP